MDDDAVKPADETPEPETGTPSAGGATEPASATSPDPEPEPARSARPTFDDQPPWERPGRPRNAVIGLLMTVALLGAAALIGWAMFRPSTGDGPSGTVGDASGPCELRTVDEQPGGVGVPATEGVPPRSTVVINTNLGPVTVLLFGDLAPCGVASYTHLANQGFYTSASCPSMTSALTEPTLVLRCGTSIKDGGPGYRVHAEHPFSDTAVVDALALVNDDSGRSGAEFAFIRGQSMPTNNLTVIGQVIDGFNVLDSITAGAGAADYTGAPPMPVTILSVSVVPGTVLNPSNGGSSGPGLPTGFPT